MNIFKRSSLYLFRNRKKSILLLFILLVVSTMVLSGLSVMGATEESSTELRSSTGTSFTLEQNMSTATKEWVDSGSYMIIQELISNEMIDKISKIDGVEDYNAKRESLGDLKINGEFKETLVFTDWYTNPILKYGLGLFGGMNTKYEPLFTSGKLELTEGEYITPDDIQSAIISNDLANKYNLHVGDTFILSNTDEQIAAIRKDGVEVIPKDTEVKIIGLFNINVEQSDKNQLAQYELYENYVFLDMDTLMEVVSFVPSDYEIAEKGYQSVDFYVSDPEKLGNILSEVKNIASVNWNNFNVITNDEVYQSASNAMSNVEKLMITMVVVVVIISAIIVTIILSMWIKSRIHEAGILMSTGISKINIISQYLLETLVIAIIGFGLSYPLSKLIVEATVSGESAQVATRSFILVFCIGIAILFVAILVASFPIIKLKPREILSKMS